MEELVAIDYKILEAYDLYVKENTDFFELKTIVYLDEVVDVDDDTDEEIYPEFAIKSDLKWYFSGQVFNDIIDNIKYQLKNPSVQDYIKNLNNYSEHDCFYTFNE